MLEGHRISAFASKADNARPPGTARICKYMP